MPTTQTRSSGTPKQWPGAFGIYSRSQKAILTNIWTLIALTLVYLAAVILFAVIFNHDALEEFLANIVYVILGPMFTLVVLKGIDGKKISFSDAMKKGLRYVPPYFVVSILVGLALIGSILALLIPFFFVLPRIILAEYYVVDKNLNGLEAFKASWRETKGHSLKVWGVLGATFVMFLPVFTIIGIPVAIFLLVMYYAAGGILYRYITQQKPAA